ncbi:helicase-exonuclease AddAB subunit AddB [Caldinitratiruptor microaerophilus]|uniref:helicase-exonuclease AddAB subunit AddB n=1 Tax=Caldinitratiruptor microaerophilus TaxID=671077 RepID=UPI00222E6927|nr:helicase-exonuclease AddAB subunit AddB [Caldinitratiruptor microaerophilus]
MALRFVVGRAGTGKTRLFLDAIEAELKRAPDGPPLILLVPEQATFQMEQALLARVPGFVRAHVLSFRRLAWRVLTEVGGAARPAIGELGRRMVLRALLARRAGELRLFRRVAGRPGFPGRLARSLSEMHAYGVTPDRLEAARRALEEAGAGDSPLAAKLHDLALLFADFRAYLAGRFTDPDDSLTLLARQLPSSSLVRGAEVRVDGFQGFTPQEFAVLEALLPVARRVEVALTLDGRLLDRLDAGVEPAPEDVFHPTAATYVRLRRIARQQGVRVEPPRVLDGGDPPVRFRAAPALAHLERAYFDPGAVPLSGPAPEVALVTARNRRAEVEAAAREILRLVREEGYRFRDIAVIVRDLGEYHDLVAAVFASQGIPHFVDRRRPVLHHPLVELVRSALEVVISDWAYEPVFRLLKTDLVPVPRADVDVLENYVLEHGIRGPAWYRPEPWRFRRRFTLDEDGGPSEAEAAWLAEVNRIRDGATAALRELQERLGPARRAPAPVRALAEALHGFLEALGVHGQLLHWSAEADARGDPDAAQEHMQVYGGVLELLDQVVESLGDQAMTLAEFLEVVEAGLEGLEVGLIPPGLDQVVVGSVERSRHPDLRAAFVLGVADGVFPRAGSEDVILSDPDRDRLAELGLELGPTARQVTLEEQFRVYLALTRARERLWLSCPLADDRGRAVWPSSVFVRVQELLPEAPRRHMEAAGEDDPAGAATIPELAGRVAARLRRALEPSSAGFPATGTGPMGVSGESLEPWLKVYQWLVTDPAAAPLARPVLSSLAYRNDPPPVDPEVAGRLYGGPVIRTSVTRLESLAACPFQHFAAHGLGLRERAVFQVGPPQLGFVQHAALQRLAHDLERDPAGWEGLDAAEAERRIGALLDDLAPRLRGEGLVPTGLERYLMRQVRRSLAGAVLVLAEHARRGRFRPVAVELPFGEADGLPGLAVAGPGGRQVVLRGRIDRVDAAEGPGGRLYLRVVDYKSTARALRAAELYHGLSLQLAVYLLVALAGADRLVGAPAEPAGLLYFPLAAAPLSGSGPVSPEEALAAWRRALRMRGVVLADPAVVRLMEAEGAGELVPARIKKDGQVDSRSGALPPARLRRLLRHVRGRLAGLVGQMLAGDVRIAPYRLGDATPCATCAYRAVCRLDPRTERDRFRTLPRARDRDVWALLDDADGADPASRPDPAEEG